ncbi:Asp23/Gls24 family envelope stress response protein [Actinomycetospora sp. OC33-EN08]|uniref:Asp23/Gls24 family envelope stress response protein n=1 Tax=Actinomycetospora aurantiaca TaxID=3129233 RepID=A0ABU8MUY1_9PSEU
MTAATPPPPPLTDPTGVTGSTEVLPAVVQKVVAFATREIPGIAGLGGTTARAVGAVRQTLTGASDNVAGVRVEMDGERATVGLDVAIEYGAGARELTRALRRHVPEAVDQIAGVQVTELNIVITDVVLPGAEEDPVAPPTAAV